MSPFILAAEYVADTVALIVYLEHLGSVQILRRFSIPPKTQIQSFIFPRLFSPKFLYLSEKGRISTNLQDAKNLLQTNSNFCESPLTQEIIETAAQITDIPELHDRLISATARLMNLELITTDTKIQNSTFVKTVW